MAATILLTTVLIPLLLGCLLAIAVRYLNGNGVVATALALIAALLVYYFLEGIPPLPPVSSKHKIAYVFVVFGAIGLASLRFRPRPHALVTAAGLLAAVLWIGWRKISSDPLQLEVFLALLPVIGLGLASSAPTPHVQNPFLWPATLIALAISASLVSILGGYIGLAQMLGAFAALTGGTLAVSYVSTFVLKRSANHVDMSQVVLLMTAAISTILASVALFASKLSAPAFVLVNLIYLAPFVSARFRTVGAWWAPFAMGVVAAVPALLAILTAWLSAQ